MRRNLFGVAIASVALFTTSANADQLFGSFEGNLVSSLPTGTSFALNNSTAALNPSATLQYTATGATQGATSLRLRLPLTFDFGLSLTEGGGVTGLKTAHNSNDRLLFDVTIPQINTAAGAPDTDGYVVFLPAINSDGTGGGFRQSPGNLQIVAGGSGDNAYNKGTVTFAWNYRAENLLFPADSAAPNGFTQFNLALNSGNLDTAPLAYFDNFRFVTIPEPTTLGTLAAVSSLIARRRR